MSFFEIPKTALLSEMRQLKKDGAPSPTFLKILKEMITYTSVIVHHGLDDEMMLEQVLKTAIALPDNILEQIERGIQNQPMYVGCALSPLVVLNKCILDVICSKSRSS